MLFCVAEFPATGAAQQYLARALVGNVTRCEPADTGIAELVLQALAKLAAEVVACGVGVAQLDNPDWLLPLFIFQIAQALPECRGFAVAVVEQQGRFIGCYGRHRLG